MVSEEMAFSCQERSGVILWLRAIRSRYSQSILSWSKASILADCSGSLRLRAQQRSSLASGESIVTGILTRLSSMALDNRTKSRQNSRHHCVRPGKTEALGQSLFDVGVLRVYLKFGREPD